MNYTAVRIIVLGFVVSAASSLIAQTDNAQNENRSNEQQEPQLQVPKTDLDFWNNKKFVHSNNCYNYSTNRRTNTFAQPGQASGKRVTDMSCEAVIEAAARDVGLEQVDFFEINNKKELTLIALVVANDYDYHWYRRDSSDLWTHKPGGTPATYFDGSDHLITDPETADRDMYTEFCGYFAVENYPRTEHEQNAGYVVIGNMKDLPEMSEQDDVAKDDSEDQSHVEFLVYSGRTNPQILLRDLFNDKKLKKKLLALKQSSILNKEQLPKQGLGYNGILIHDSEGLISKEKKTHFVHSSIISNGDLLTLKARRENGLESTKKTTYEVLEESILNKASALGLKKVLTQSGALKE